MSEEPEGGTAGQPASMHAAEADDPGRLRLALDPATPAVQLPPPVDMPAADLPPPRPRVLATVRLRDELLLWLRTIITAAIYAALIVTFLFQVARVEGQSMAPTLQNQDRVIVNKLAYHLGDPRRGDIVMLYYPIDPVKSFVKRVIAEAGDTVRIADGIVYVNNVRQPDAYVPAAYRSHDEWGPAVIPEGYYFVMGDHRNDSSDSRQWGMVPKKYIVGRIELRWWPVPRARLF